MIFFETYITDTTFEFFQENIKTLSNYNEINSLIKKVSGINNFFTSQNEAIELLEKIKEQNSIVAEPDRREYGDFQTNMNLAFQVAEYALSKYDNFEFILEPTCGKGNFLLAALSQFKSLKKIMGVEIYQPYIWETKFKILTYFLINGKNSKPEIDIIHGNAFEFPYEELANSTKQLKTLVIGNPPWVTNSELGSIDSKNLPEKSNFKRHKGFEAMTGKGNFDIGEYISLTMLKCFENHNGLFAFLIKNSVVKNLIQDQKQNKYRISKSEKLNIDSKKEFNVSVNACLFVAHLNSEPDLTCEELDFYSRNHITTFGWYKDKFVNSIRDYDKTSVIDGKSIFTWRSGIKHDCAKIMELEQHNAHFVNGFGEKIKLEKDLIYSLLKSSDLKEKVSNTYRKLTIITQKRIGDSTSYIKDKLPLTSQYLEANKEHFIKRKSSIYKDKPDFSIFGVGDYSFTKYKIAISGLYKSTHFTLVGPNNSKPTMLDDTCYLIGFDNLKMALIAHYILNSHLVQRFLKSVIFSDSKRSINKDTLMRIDFEKAYNSLNFNDVKEEFEDIMLDEWLEFGKIVKDKENVQLELF